MMNQDNNLDVKTVQGFGDEWTRFKQNHSDTELQKIFNQYFLNFPWNVLPDKAIGADIGCGSGRWAKWVLPRVGLLKLVDPSRQALQVASQNLSGFDNVEFFNASVGCLPFEEHSLDFAYCLGVLHHVPDTQRAILAISRTLKPGAPFLIYLYYNFENRHPVYKAIWQMSETLRCGISKMPHAMRYQFSQILALSVYWPLARTSRVLENLHIKVDSIPLSFYRDKSFYTMRTDALDRFGTRLEKRFSKADITHLLTQADFTEIQFNPDPPFWCAVCRKRI